MAGNFKTPLVHRASRLVCAALLGVTLHATALSQTPGSASLSDTVTWTVSAPPAGEVKPGSRLSLKLRGAVVDGWHVYALEQLPGGPIPLRVALEPGEIATADGPPSGSPSTRAHDPSFDLDTQFYSKDFEITAPVRVGSKLAAGPQQIPLSVRFQTCNGKTCRPPKTIHLSAPIMVAKAG